MIFFNHNSNKIILPAYKFLMPLVLLLGISIHGNSQQYNFTNYSIESGLAQSQINNIVEDSSGKLWIATNGGISVFNGIEFKNYNKHSNFFEDQITAIFESKDKRIFIGSAKGNIYIFENHTFKKINTNKFNAPISDFTQDHSGLIWIAIKEAGLYVYSYNKFYPISLTQGDKNVNVNTLFTDRKGKIWIGTQNQGLYLYNEGRIKHINTRSGISNNTINSIQQDSIGNIIVATNYGLSKISDNKISNFYQNDGLCSNKITALSIDKNNNIWIGTDNNGLCRKTHKGFIHYNKQNGLQNENITDLICDNSGIIWIGTDRGGLIKYGGDRFKHLTEKDGLPNDIVMAIMEDSKHNLWFGTYGDGVCKYSKNEFTYFNTTDGLCSNVIYSIIEDSKGNIWFGSKGNGVSMFDGKKFTNYDINNGLKSNMVYSIIEDHNKNIILGTLGGGISIYKNNTFTNITKENGLSSNNIYFVFEDLEHNLFIGTKESGVDLIFKTYDSNDIYINKHIPTNNIINISGKYGLKNEQVISITEDPKGVLWFGSFGGGITRFDGKDLKTYNINSGLSSNNIYNLLFDSRGYLWAGSEKGVDRIHFTNSGKKINVKSYSKGEGFKGIETNLNSTIEDHNGYLWFATIKGVSRYNPNADIINNTAPKIQITDIKLFSENINWNEDSGSISTSTYALSLPYDKNHLTFSFIGIEKTAPKKVQYSYILEGFDENWSKPDNQNKVTYSYIPNGEYTFKVKAANADGIWTTKPAKLHFRIHPPFYLTSWFIISALIAIGLIVYFTIRYRSRQLEKANLKLDNLVKIRTALLEREKRLVEEKSAELSSLNSQLKDKNDKLLELSAVAEETDNSVVIADKEGQLLWANKGFEKMYGLSFDKFRQKHGDNLISTSWNKEIHLHIKNCIKNKGSIIYTTDQIIEDEKGEKKTMYIQTTMTPVFDNETGDLLRIIAIDVDITDIEHEKKKSETLLHNILPKQTANELKDTGKTSPRKFRKVSILFTDFKGFTNISEQLSPSDLVNKLNYYFSEFDNMVTSSDSENDKYADNDSENENKQFVIEKIKTIGDAYMCAGGLPIRNKSHPIDTVLFALRIQHKMKEFNKINKEKGEPEWPLRVGIHTGPVVAGVVGKKKFAYDIWGDSVNIASRMESSGEPGKVNISGTTYKYIQDYFDCEYRGKIEAKNKGKIDMYFVTGIKPELCIDPDVRIFPNEKFNSLLSQL